MAHRGPLLLLASLVATVACGGAAPPARSHTRAQDETSGSEAADQGPSLPCDDGTCSACGRGFCPTGYYCDEKAKGGAACSWLPECADRATCGCVTAALGSSCACEERGGGVYVTCS